MPDGPPRCRQLRQHLGTGQWLRRPAPQGAARREGRRWAHGFEGLSEEKKEMNVRHCTPRDMALSNAAQCVREVPNVFGSFSRCYTDGADQKDANSTVRL